MGLYKEFANAAIALWPTASKVEELDFYILADEWAALVLGERGADPLLYREQAHAGVVKAMLNQ